MNRARTCRPWVTYRGQPRTFAPWCECGWRTNTYQHLSEAQQLIDRHLVHAADHRRHS